MYGRKFDRKHDEQPSTAVRDERSHVLDFTAWCDEIWIYDRSAFQPQIESPREEASLRNNEAKYCLIVIYVLTVLA